MTTHQRSKSWAYGIPKIIFDNPATDLNVTDEYIAYLFPDKIDDICFEPDSRSTKLVHDIENLRRLVATGTKRVTLEDLDMTVTDLLQ